MTPVTSNAKRDRLAHLFSDRDKTTIVGVLNVTPDSFSDGGFFLDPDRAIAQCRQLMAEGADIIDIGGQSSRPGSQPVSAAEELKRILPVIEQVAPGGAVPISVDTCRASVADAALQAGAEIINDITALHGDRELAKVVAAHGAGLILMHMRGTPETMQADTTYDDLIEEIAAYLSGAVETAEAAGVARELIMIDPGIGFGKDVQGNLDIIKALPRFRQLGRPVLVGVSRKSFIGKITGAEVGERLPGSLTAAVAAVLQGAAAVRVHEVAATRQAVDIAVRLRQK